MSIAQRLINALRWTHDQWAEECLPEWAGDDFEWTIPPDSFGTRAFRLMVHGRCGRLAIPRAHRRAVSRPCRIVPVQRDALQGRRCLACGGTGLGLGINPCDACQGGAQRG